jgi:hypothetical protein
VAVRIGQSVTLLRVSCSRCDRSGRLRLDRLIAAHDAALPVPALRRIVAADCARVIENKMHDAYGVHFLELSVGFR